MTNQPIETIIDRTERLIEERVNETPGLIPRIDLSSLVMASNLSPAWWSPGRDDYLHQFWHSNNYLSMAVYSSQAKLTSIPWYIEPVDRSVPAHHLQADETAFLLNVGSEFGESIHTTLIRFYSDLLTTDNGGFMEIIGEGRPDGAIEGRPIAVRHLDSSRCIRTGDKSYPVLYREADGRLYKLHRSRVIYMSQMSSPRTLMNGVGFCAISRCMEIARSLADIITYKQERLGSRPRSQLLVGRGITGQQIINALMMMDAQLDAMGHKLYARTAAIGSENPEISIETVDLHDLEPFNEEVSVQLGMTAVSIAFGMDVGELWPSAVGRTSVSDAKIGNLRSKNKLAGQVTRALESQFNLKFLPSYLKFRFDFRDDDEDQQKAIIADINARRRDRDIRNQIMSPRASRYSMLDTGELKRTTFDELELRDGRLEDGTPVESLFFDKHPDFAQYLNLGVPNPLVLSENDPAEMIGRIQASTQRVYARLSETNGKEMKKRMLQAISALSRLEEQYTKERDRVIATTPVQPPPEPDDSEDDDEGENEKPPRGSTRLVSTSTIKSIEDDRDSVLKLADLVANAITDMLINGTGAEELDGMRDTYMLDAYKLGAGTDADLSPFDDYLSDLAEVAQKLVSEFSSKASSDPVARGQEWGAIVKSLYNLGLLHRKGLGDTLLRWVRDPQKDSCSHCIGFDGAVKTRSEWRDTGFHPQSHRLECFGIHCGCSFEEVQ